MKFKDYSVGWHLSDGTFSPSPYQTLILMLPNRKYHLAGYRKNPYGRKNGHYYWCYKGFVTKSLDKLKEHILNSVHTEALEIINFTKGLKNDKR